MALFVDNDHVSLADMTAVDPEVPTIADAEGVSVQAAITRGWQNAAVLLNRWLMGNGMAFSGHNAAVFGTTISPNIDNVVASALPPGNRSPIQQLILYSAMAEFYGAASVRKITDRMTDKQERARAEGQRWSDEVQRAGIPVVWSPLPCPGAKHWFGPTFGAGNVSKIPGGDGTGTVYVAITWTAGGGRWEGESGPSAIVAVDLAANETIAVSVAGLMVPGVSEIPPPVAGMASPIMTATGWHVYVGTSPDLMYRQTATPVPVGTDSYGLPGAPVLSGELLWGGQAANGIARVQNMIWRA